MQSKELVIMEFEQALSIQRKADIILDPYKFIGFGIHKSECKVEIWKLEDKAIVLFTDTGKGTSVTNAAEQLVTEIYNDYLLYYKKEQCLFAETYDKVKEGIDVITPTEWSGNKCTDIEWFHLGKIVK